MKILAFDASARAASVALVEDDILIAESYLNIGLTHSQTLLPLCENLLQKTGVSIDSIDVIAVTAGPGSFTGIRIAIASVKGLAFGREIGCAAISTLEALATQAKLFEGIVCAVMDARCGQVYNALFESSGGKLTRITPDRALSIAELEIELINFEKMAIIIGDGADLCYNTFNSSENFILAPPEVRMVHASSAAFLAKGCILTKPEELGAIYLRLPQAERERNERLRT